VVFAQGEKKPVHPELSRVNGLGQLSPYGEVPENRSTRSRGRTGFEKLGTNGAGLLHEAAAEGLFIWQLVGVLDTYGSICLIGTKV
jgi:hypothetical protein